MLFPPSAYDVFVYPKNKLTNLHPLHENLENGAKTVTPQMCCLNDGIG
jgi:hypothetical protein